MTVTALPGVQVESDRKALFVNDMAASFDRYVADFGCEPEAFVVVMGGLRQNARVSWTTQGDTEGGAVSMLAIAQATILKEIVNPG
jgi:hypothetical protein